VGSGIIEDRETEHIERVIAGKEVRSDTAGQRGQQGATTGERDTPDVLYQEGAAQRLSAKPKVKPTTARQTPAGRRESERRESVATARLIHEQDSKPAAAPTPRPLTPRPELQTAVNPFSTFSLNVSDVSFKLAAASLAQGQLPDASRVRSEEFINALDYHDPAPARGQPLAFAWERAHYPFAHNRDLLRFSVQTAAQGRETGRPLNLVLLLDNSGSMERSDRVSIIRECLNVLCGQLKPQDKVSVVTFARTARLWVDGVPGVQAAASLAAAGQLTPEGGTNLEEAMRLAYATAERHYIENGLNRVVLLTDGAANLGNVDPEPLKRRVELKRRQGIALDCFGIGWEGYNDDLLEGLSRNGDGRYGFVNSPQDASASFAAQLAGALHVAASDVKVQVQFNPQRVTAYRQIGYARHQLTREQFRDNTVDAAEIGSAESGNALYVIETNPHGTGPLATVRARFKIPATGHYREYEWPVAYTGEVPSLENASATMRLAACASAFSEWLAASPYAGEVTPQQLLQLLVGVPEAFGPDSRPRKLEGMIREAGRIAGN
jgi:Mg-chelatase subunit ChlD